MAKKQRYTRQCGVARSLLVLLRFHPSPTINPELAFDDKVGIKLVADK